MQKYAVFDGQNCCYCWIMCVCLHWVDHMHLRWFTAVMLLIWASPTWHRGLSSWLDLWGVDWHICVQSRIGKGPFLGRKGASASLPVYWIGIVARGGGWGGKAWHLVITKSKLFTPFSVALISSWCLDLLIWKLGETTCFLELFGGSKEVEDMK